VRTTGHSRLSEQFHRDPRRTTGHPRLSGAIEWCIINNRPNYRSSTVIGNNQMVYNKLPRELPDTRGYRSNFVGTLAEAHGHPRLSGAIKWCIINYRANYRSSAVIGDNQAGISTGSDYGVYFTGQLPVNFKFKLLIGNQTVY
jgi:hypothetical protein